MTVDNEGPYVKADRQMMRYGCLFFVVIVIVVLTVVLTAKRERSTSLPDNTARDLPASKK